MKTIAIVGAGPTGIYTLFSLLQQQTPLSISIFEQADEAGVGMPYSDDENSKLMLANIASIEIPPIYCTYLEWLQKQEASHLQRYGVKKETLHDRQFLPRILDAPRDKCTLSCAINGIHAAFHYLKKNYISGCVMTVPTG